MEDAVSVKTFFRRKNHFSFPFFSCSRDLPCLLIAPSLFEGSFRHQLYFQNGRTWQFGKSRGSVSHLFYVNNVSSTNSEQSNLCVKCPLYIDARFLWEQAICC